MRIILLQDIRNLGKRNDIKTVSDGYAANFLFPKKLAVPATAETMAERQALTAREEHTLKTLRENAARMEKEALPFALKKGAHGEIFSSIGKSDIMQALAAKGYAGIKTVDLHASIKKIGAHAVTVRLERGIAATVTVIAQ